MKKLIAVAALTCLALAGCAYNSTTITAQGDLTYSGTNTVDRPVTVETQAQGNVPVQGGTVSNPAQTK